MADATYKMQITLSDGSTIDAGNFTAPQGPAGATGAKGADGVSITNVKITAVTG